MSTRLFSILMVMLLISCGADKSTKESSSSTITHVPAGDQVDEENLANPDQLDGYKQVEVSKELLEKAKEENNSKNTLANEKKSKPKPRAKKKRPVITYDSLVYHLPDVIEGEVIHHDINFTNTGDAPLSISYVKPSCGCTQPSFPFLDIAPGESGVIGVDYHSVGKDGPQQAELTVITNSLPKESVVTIEVNVLPKPDDDSSSN